MGTLKTFFARGAALAIAAVGLTGCDTNGVYVNRTESLTYAGSVDVYFTAANGTNQVVVYNSPYAPDATINSVLAAAQKRYASNQYRFFAGPPTPEWNGYTVILGFGGSPVGNQNLCKNRDAKLRPMPADQTSIFAEYCTGDVLVAEVSAHTTPVSGPDDPRFSELIGATLSSLFSYRVPVHTGATQK